MNKKKKDTWTIIGCILLALVVRILPVVILLWLFISAKVEVYTDIRLYNDYIGSTANESFKDKWEMDETIFPKSISDNMNVLDYKMVYYNPWDAQFLSYLVVKYNENDYETEVNRLTNYGINKYTGYYSVTGFTKYHLLAMYADSYNGFVYAITDDVDTIIYVEIIFCNYYMDLDYKEYINNDYLPDGFDATINNPYSKKLLKD